MAICPFATFKEISGSSGPYIGGPFKIVHHTTEGSTAQGAFDAFEQNRSDPHFTLDGDNIFQHIDTAVAARSLRNDPGGVQTNRDSAVQIEVVGFAHRPKTKPTLINLARLCRWIEHEHGVPKVWPNGFPKAAVNGHDPGGHNRDPNNWDTLGGHYGHSQVPENTHWDPGYTTDEVNFLMEAGAGPGFDMPAGASPELDSAIQRYPSIPDQDPGLSGAVSTMPDHNDVE